MSKLEKWVEFKSLEKTISHSKSYKEYRLHLRCLNPPCVPYLGIYLTGSSLSPLSLFLFFSIFVFPFYFFFFSFVDLLHGINFISLADLTFLYDGNPDTVDGLVNFKKQMKIANVISEVQMYQPRYTAITPDEPLQAILSNFLPQRSESGAVKK